MPELPEVEVTRLGIKPHLEGRVVTKVNIVDGRLRWPVPKTLSKTLLGQELQTIERRGKYLLLRMTEGYLIIHLGMTGVLRVLPHLDPLKPHDRVSIHFDDISLRLHDPRKFGAVLWHSHSKGNVLEHPLIQKLGPEPLASEFAGQLGADRLYQFSRKRTISVKAFLLAGQAVVGVGNIYCSESLFEAGIHPSLPAGKLTKAQCARLAQAVRTILSKAIKAGGSSLRNFVDAHGEPGYFMMQTKVYDRGDEQCQVCKAQIRQITQGQRSTYYCPICQKR
jgi:formamidopyrimidine-DNA glycosylase